VLRGFRETGKGETEVVVMHRHIPSFTVPVASGIFRVSLCQSPAAISVPHCASRQRKFPSLTVPVASGNFRVSLCQSPATPSGSHCASRHGTFRVSLCQSPAALSESHCASRHGTCCQHTKVICFDASTALFMISLPVFETVLTGKFLPTFRINFLPPSSG
jgi:hypothetical protein